MARRFIAEFDRVGLALWLGALLTLLYFGIGKPELYQEIWVAFAFLFVGFVGSYTLGLTKFSSKFKIENLFVMGVLVAVIIGLFFAANIVYSSTVPQELIPTDKLLAAAIGIAEEIFFGVFVLGLLINILGVNKVGAIIASALAHAVYHIPNWGTDPKILALFTFCFVASRSIYVYVFPKVGLLLAGHGFWNWLVM